MLNGRMLCRLSGFWLNVGLFIGNNAEGISVSTDVGRAEAESGEVAVSADGDTDDVDESSE